MGLQTHLQLGARFSSGGLVGVLCGSKLKAEMGRAFFVRQNIGSCMLDVAHFPLISSWKFNMFIPKYDWWDFGKAGMLEACLYIDSIPSTFPSRPLVQYLFVDAPSSQAQVAGTIWTQASFLPTSWVGAEKNCQRYLFTQNIHGWDGASEGHAPKSKGWCFGTWILWLSISWE